MERSGRARRVVQTLLGLAAVAAVVGMVAGAVLLADELAGDDGSAAGAAAPLLYAPGAAEDIARKAILDPDDLGDPMASGWSLVFENAGVGEGDAFETPFGDGSPGDDSCRDFNDLADTARDDLAARFEGRTAVYEVSRLFERPGFGQLDTASNVEASIAIFSQPGYVEALIERYRELFEHESFLSCMEASFAQGPSGDPSTLDIDPPSADLPGPGAGIAIEVRTDVTGEGGVPLTRLTTRIEFYVWADGNALIDLVVSGKAGDVDDDLVALAMTRVQEKLEDERVE